MITEKYIQFFKELEKNNRREWFHEHKKEYERDVKNPFLQLLETIIPKVEKLEPKISLHSKDTVFRINRDVRFSKDKTPYHTLLKASFAPGGKKSLLPGYYLGISATTIHIGGGLFNLKTDNIKNVRLLILNNIEEFCTIVEAKSFLENFGKLKGEQAKRLDKRFQTVYEKVPYIANKQFYAMKEVPVTDYLCSDKLIPFIIDSFKEISTLNSFLKKSFK